jgi:SET family sugar efflux transporter-like MFS transporter
VRAALTELADRGLALRLAVLGAIGAMPTLYMMTIALILTRIGGRPASDPGLFFGFVTGAEVPSALLLTLGVALSVVFLLALPILAHNGLVWVLILPLALANGVILTIPITYLQDLLANRPGTGTALVAF